MTTPNRDPFLSHVPISGVDICEHAFYLQYLRPHRQGLGELSIGNEGDTSTRGLDGPSANLRVHFGHLSITLHAVHQRKILRSM